jgi:hypothetical protein
MAQQSISHHSPREINDQHYSSWYSLFIKYMRDVQGNANSTRRAKFRIGLVFLVIMAIISIMVLAVSLF